MDGTFRSLLGSFFGAVPMNQEGGMGRGQNPYNNPFMFNQNRPRQFYRQFIPLPPAFWHNEDPSKLEQGDKIVLPQSALDELSRMNIQFPIMFQITNEHTKKTSHCSVLEFTAIEGNVYLPLWIFDNLQMDPNSTQNLVSLRNVSLQKGTFVKLQPHTSNFTELSNPRTLLEVALRNFSCLTKNDTIQISPKGLGQTYQLNIVETQPADQVSIIETDVRVEFIEPLDYQSFLARKNASRRVVQEEEKVEKKKDVYSDDELMGGLLGDSEGISSNHKAVKKRYFGRLKGGHKLNGKPIPGKRTRPGLGCGSPPGGKSKKRVEEIIGKMRYIYEIDSVTGEKTVVRRLPLRKNLGKGFTCADTDN